MIDVQSLHHLKQEIALRMSEDRGVLDELRAEIRPLRASVRRIQPRSVTAVSLVGTDGGNNSLQFDPFLVQLIRVVDSSNNEYCLEAITPTTKIQQLSANQFHEDGRPRTALGRMMSYLGVRTLVEVSHMIRVGEDDRAESPSWVQVYRELVEWAILFTMVREKDFGTDTLIVFDGLLRSKVFAGALFGRFLQGIAEGIDHQWQKNRRHLYLVGVAKHSKVLTQYRLAMALEHLLATEHPAYVAIPRDLEERSYVWAEFARGDDRVSEQGEANKQVGGSMFFVKFGSSPRDPIWPVDIYTPQAKEAQTILGYMLADAINGFPVPFYPLCLQRAHEHAALVDFDLDVLQDEIYDAMRQVLGAEAPVLDAFRLQDRDPAQARY